MPRVRLDELPAADSHSAGFYAHHVDSASDVRKLRSLECVECGRVWRDGERGWTAYLTAEDDGTDGVAVYCSRCSQVEFDR